MRQLIKKINLYNYADLIKPENIGILDNVIHNNYNINTELGDWYNYILDDESEKLTRAEK